MKRGTVAAVVGLLVLAAVVAAVGPAAALGGADVLNDEGNETSERDANATSPGEQFAGVVGVGAAEVSGEVERRSFERRVDENRSDAERADAVAARLDANEQRLTELEERKASLTAEYEAGNLTRGAYRARMATLAAETRSIERTTNRSADVAAELPAEELSARGVDDTRIAELRDRASELSGPEVAEMAREIAGPNVGGGAGPPGNVTPGDGGPSNGNGAAGNAGENGPANETTPGSGDESAGASGNAADGNAGNDAGDENAGNESPGDGDENGTNVGSTGTNDDAEAEDGGNGGATRGGADDDGTTQNRLAVTVD